MPRTAEPGPFVCNLRTPRRPQDYAVGAAHEVRSEVTATSVSAFSVLTERSKLFAAERRRLPEP